MASDEDESLQELELQGLTSVRRIAGVAIPAVVLNAAPPVTVAVQTALIGNLAPTSALAAFAAVGTVVGFVSRVFNFLVDGVSAKVGRSVGQRDWGALGTHVRLSLHWSALLGTVAVPLLLVVRRPSCAWLLDLSEEVQAAAAGYWTLRTAAIPVQLLNMSAAGILQGFGRVRINAVLTSSASVLEVLGSAAVLRLQAAQQAGGGSLVGLGWVTFITQALLAVATVVCIVVLPPSEARGQVHLVHAVLGRRSSRHSSSEQSGTSSSLQQPLLAGAGQLPGDSRLELSVGGDDAAGSSIHQRPGAQHEARQQEQQQRASLQPGGRWLDDATLEFLRDGLNMFIRTLVLQLTFFMALAAAARLGTTVLAAHSIVGQLWVVVSYAVDGFAAAGIVLGSRLYGFARGHPRQQAEAKRHMQRLYNRVLLAGGVSGAAAGLAFYLFQGSLASLFTADPEVVAALRSGAWAVLAWAQPLNGLLFVFDGLLLSTNSFKFVRDYMSLGFLLVFCPALALEYFLFPGLAAIWLAKAALNVWRLGGAAFLIYWRFLPQFSVAGGSEQQGEQRACDHHAPPDGSGEA